MNKKSHPLISPIQEPESRKGAIPTVFGVILVILGSLDSMLAWRGSFEVSKFSIGIMAAGFIFFCIGAVLNRADKTRNSE